MGENLINHNNKFNVYCIALFFLTFFALTCFTKESIYEKELFFENAKANVKTEFVGHDQTIDNIFASIKSWYLFPETRKGIKIICLWGMTGTGKTSIVESIVRHLGLENDFNYYDMDKYTRNENSISQDLTRAYSRKSHTKLKLSEIKIPKNPILMFDEIQKVNTINPYRLGEPVDRPGAQVIWEILGSNGKITIDNPKHTELLSMLKYEHELPISNELKYGKNDSMRSEAIEDLRNEIKEILDQTPRQTKLDLSNSLIFMAGNLDHVFTGSGLLDPEAISADELHSITRAIPSIRIKQGLNALFRPEQVARMRNNHIIFPTLSAQSFVDYILLKLVEIKKDALDLKIELMFSKDFVLRLYSEGVIPSQGVRPVSGFIDAFARDPIAEMYLHVQKAKWYGNNRPAKIFVDAGPVDKVGSWTFLNGPLKKKSATFPIPSESLNQYMMHPEPFKSLVALHEAGHATLELFINRKIPRAIRSTSRNPSAGGFVKPAHKPSGFVYLKSHLISEIAVTLAGGVAEDLILGERSTGSSHDIIQATAIAENMVNNSGMGNDGNIASNKIIPRLDSEISKQVEELLEEGRAMAQKILTQERNFHAALTEHLKLYPVANSSDVEKLLKETWSNTAEAEEIIEGKGPKHQTDKLIEAFINACKNKSIK